jgi:hypothetical protein
MTTGNNLGPPGEEPGPTAKTGSHQQSARSTDKPMICHPGVAGWLRRRRAAQRLMPLDCGCADPWPCRCRRADPLTDHQVDGWRAAALDIIEDGHAPIVPVEVVRRLWKRGGRDRELAERLRALTGGMVA